MRHVGFALLLLSLTAAAPVAAYGNDGHRGSTTGRHYCSGGGHHHGPSTTTTTSSTTTSTTLVSTTTEPTTTTSSTTVSTTTEPTTTAPTTTVPTTTTSSTTVPTTTEPTTTTSIPLETATTGPTTTTSSTTEPSTTAPTTTTPSTTVPSTICPSTTTPVPSTTSTTLAGPAEICGNCIDDDGNGLVDDADPTCCSEPMALGVMKAKVRGKKGNLAHAKLRLRTKLAGAFAGADPTTEPLILQLAGDDGTVICETLAPWVRKGKQFRYKGAATGMTKGIFRVGHAGVTFKAKGREMDLHALPGSEVRATLRIGSRCATGRAPLRQMKNKALLAP